MRIQCPNCPAAYELDDGRVPPAGLSIKCPKCKTPFTVHQPKPGERKAVTSKVALPGTGTPPAGKPPVPPGSVGAAGRSVVPLPGAPAFRTTATPGATPAAPPPDDPFAEPVTPAAAQMHAPSLPGLDDDTASAKTVTDFRPAKQDEFDSAFGPFTGSCGSPR